MYVDEHRASCEKKKNELILVCKEWPKFQSALFQLAVCYMQLDRPKDAIFILEKLHALNPSDITCEYYLASLYIDRYNAPMAWKHIECAEALTADVCRRIRPLEELRLHVQMMSPK
jgi:tetratricopeptide (TPR) repeat protein